MPIPNSLINCELSLFPFIGWLWRHLLHDGLGSGVHHLLRVRGSRHLCQLLARNRISHWKQAKVRLDLGLDTGTIFVLSICFSLTIALVLLWVKFALILKSLPFTLNYEMNRRIGNGLRSFLKKTIISFEIVNVLPCGYFFDVSFPTLTFFPMNFPQ